MLWVVYCFCIRSECHLCEEMHLNLAYRWLCRLELSDPILNHSTFSKNRHGRFQESKLLRNLFEKTVGRCIADGLVSGQRLLADASLIETDANKQNSTPKEDWNRSAIDPNDASRAVKEYLDVLDDAAFGAASEVEPKLRPNPTTQASGRQHAKVLRSLAFRQTIKSIRNRALSSMSSQAVIF